MGRNTKANAITAATTIFRTDLRLNIFTNDCNMALRLIRPRMGGISWLPLSTLFSIVAVVDRMMGDERTLDVPIRLLLMFATAPIRDIATGEAMGEKATA
eukprot:scaffold5622_cov129-Cylindrotheca_fusiformis.AAC.2